MSKLFKTILFGSVFLFVSHAYSASAYTPVSVNIFPPIQFPSDDFNIRGLRLSVWGRHRSMYGLDLALLGNHTKQEFVGLALSGLFNRTEGMTTVIGGQIAGVTNLNSQKTDVVGLQMALVANYNGATSSVTGLQFALANLAAHTNIYGIQAGVYNRAKEVYGFQIGLVNVTDSLHGIQLGLVNIHRLGTISISPILNIGF